jgi:hypothetical protein
MQSPVRNIEALHETYHKSRISSFQAQQYLRQTGDEVKGLWE